MLTTDFDLRTIAANYPAIRPEILEAIIRYANDHMKPGSLTHRLLEGDIRSALSHAHPSLSAVSVCQTLDFIDEQLPPECHGSPERVAAWLKGGR